MTTATKLVREMSAGSERAADELLPLVYSQLHELAARYMQRERADHLLQPTALVHEAYARLVDDSQVDWNGRTHFLAIASRAMQRVLIDHARSRDRQKRGGEGENKWRRVELNDAFQIGQDRRLDMLELEDALVKMHQLDPRQARVASLRIFGELSDQQIAALLDVSERTVERDWKMAKAWLRRELASSSGGP